MRLRLAAAALAVLALAACTAVPEVEPVHVVLSELPGATVEVPLGGSIFVDTEDAGLDDMRAEVADPAVVEFTEGANTGDMGFYPAFTPLAVGRTDVSVSSADGLAEPFDFTIVVVP